MSFKYKDVINCLNEIAEKEEKLVPQWVADRFVAECTIPPLAKENTVKCKVAVVAPVSAGKSTLFNSSCGYPILPVASTATSCAPTYITRVESQTDECVTVYAIEEKVEEDEGVKSTSYVRNEESKKVYSPENITPEMFNDLFEYMYLIIHGLGIEDGKKIENIGYFMASPEKVDTFFYGEMHEIRELKREDFEISYDKKRHRLLLLLILLCVYVSQNDKEEKMSEYIKEVNRMRTALLAKYGLPVMCDYCVCLDWCNDDIPEDVTLIDLPGTGADVEDTDKQSSHTRLVRGILEEADAIWVLCSDNGVADPDLLWALRDVVEGDARKNKVCIYNCKNKKYGDSQPVTDFLKKLPYLTGERCYVVNAMAGEFKYIQNGINCLYTQFASDKRYNDFEDPTEGEIKDKLEKLYSTGIRSAFCTFTTGKDAEGNIIATQDPSLKFTLESFFKCALTEYVERLRYEVALLKAIEQAQFYERITKSLYSSRDLLESINGKGEEISKAVSEALKTASKEAIEKFVIIGAKHHKNITDKLTTLAESMKKRIEAQFTTDLNALINTLKDTWRSLENPNSPNRLEEGFWTGNYSLNLLRDVGKRNYNKFLKVRNEATDKITISAFCKAIDITDEEIKKYRTELFAYVSSLKGAVIDFKEDYINNFIKSFDDKRDSFFKDKDGALKEELYNNFNTTRDSLIKPLQEKLAVMVQTLCDSFDELIKSGGIFDKLCAETKKEFTSKFTENILDEIRSYMSSVFMKTNHIGWVLDELSKEDLANLINRDFTYKKNEYTDLLKKLIDQMYGTNGGVGGNFPANLSQKITLFNSEKVTSGAKSTIKQTHEIIITLVEFAADGTVNVEEKISQINEAISQWKEHKEDYKPLYAIEDSEVQNTHEIYLQCKALIEAIICEEEI